MRVSASAVGENAKQVCSAYRIDLCTLTDHVRQCLEQFGAGQSRQCRAKGGMGLAWRAVAGRQAGTLTIMINSSGSTCETSAPTMLSPVNSPGSNPRAAAGNHSQQMQQPVKHGEGRVHWQLGHAMREHRHTCGFAARKHSRDNLRRACIQQGPSAAAEAEALPAGCRSKPMGSHRNRVPGPGPG